MGENKVAASMHTEIEDLYKNENPQFKDIHKLVFIKKQNGQLVLVNKVSC